MAGRGCIDMRATLFTALGVMAWSFFHWHRTRRTLKDARRKEEKVDPKLYQRETGKQVDIELFLASVQFGEEWVVGWDEGGHELVVGELRMFIGVVRTEDIKKVLSHRWAPSTSTSMGPIPKVMMQARYPEPTWIDVLNHFNLTQYSAVVVRDMGHLYATIACRALYLESEQSVEEKAEACSRAWMWQELSVGPQDHAYSSAQDAYLHFVVMAGERAALDLMGRKWGRAYVALGLIGDGKGGEFYNEEYRTGGLGAVLAQVFRKHKVIECGALVSAMVEELGPVATQKAGVDEARKMMLWMWSTVLECCRVVYRKRGISDPQLERELPFWRVAASVLTLMHGSRAQTAQTGRAAAATLLAAIDKEERLVSSAAANLANRNVTVLADRLVASFGVLCAERGVACGGAAVSDIIKTAHRVTVLCLKGSDGVGVSAATRRRVAGVRVGAFKDGNGAVMSALMGAFMALTTGSWGKQGVADVAVGELSLGRCTASILGAGMGERMEARRRRAEEGAGEITSFELSGGKLARLVLSLDRGGFVTCIGMGVSGEEFWRWFEALPVAE